MPAIELPPFTTEHREAVRRLRFVTPSKDRAIAFGLTTNVELVRVFIPGAGMTEAQRLKRGAANHAAVASAGSYPRSVDPYVEEWEVKFTHPDAVAFICDLADERREA